MKRLLLALLAVTFSSLFVRAARAQEWMSVPIPCISHFESMAHANHQDVVVRGMPVSPARQAEVRARQDFWDRMDDGWEKYLSKLPPERRENEIRSLFVSTSGRLSDDESSALVMHRRFAQDDLCHMLLEE